MKITSLVILLVMLCSGFTKAPETTGAFVKEALRVYPTPKQSGSITIRSTNHQQLSFYLFDLDGTLIYQTALNSNSTQKVEGLIKGTYVYHAFNNDKSIEGGKIVLK